ncbi:MAG: TldD/PmbA family protein [Alphaproteobacteria bacterium]|jgi:PmbA protein|nr:TldD/PmbA family protein [Alphaproteobacteria bacterium]
MSTDTFSPPDLLEKLLTRCRQAGADAADARITVSEGVSVDVREGQLESVERAEEQAVSLRCFFGQRQAHVSGSELSPAGLEELAERCVAMARAVPEDPYCGLPGPDELASDARDLDLDGDGAVPEETLEREALAAEAAALAVPEVRTTSSCSAGWTRGERWLAATNGFTAYRRGSFSGLGLAVVSEREGRMERDYESRSVRYREDRPSPEEIGRIAGRRAAARLGPRRIATQKAAVIFDRRVAASLLGPLITAISGPSIARGVSFLSDRLGERVFSEGIDVIDDPFRPRGLGSRQHDGEGRRVEPVRLIEDGVLTRWLLNGSSARQLGLAPNGHAGLAFGDPPGVTTSNLYLAAGRQTPEALMKGVARGLLVTDMFGPSINPNTGDYSVGVSGFWFENGEIAHPVSEVTVAGDLASMYARLIPANDLELRGSHDAPSLLIEDMSIAGDRQEE